MKALQKHQRVTLQMSSASYIQRNISAFCAFLEQRAGPDAPTSRTLELQLHGAPQRCHGEEGVHDLPGEGIQW